MKTRISILFKSGESCAFVLPVSFEDFLKSFATAQRSGALNTFVSYPDCVINLCEVAAAAALPDPAL